MARTEIRSHKVSAPVGVFAQANSVPASGKFVFVSGLTSRAADGSVVGEGDIKLQTETVIQNLIAVLEEAGGGLDDVVKVTVFIRDMDKHFKAIHEVRSRYFKPPYPASTMVEITRLVDPRCLIEMEAVAVIQ